MLAVQAEGEERVSLKAFSVIFCQAEIATSCIYMPANDTDFFQTMKAFLS